jgi:hypothetical protein
MVNIKRLVVMTYLYKGENQFTTKDTEDTKKSRTEAKRSDAIPCKLASVDAAAIFQNRDVLEPTGAVFTESC